MEFSINKNQKLDLNLVESSFDLLSNPEFKIIKRNNWMMPTPFVLTDAVVIEQKVKPSSNYSIKSVDSLNAKIDKKLIFQKRKAPRKVIDTLR
jgi:hypothetical protein